MARTFARTGRSMKNFEIIARSWRATALFSSLVRRRERAQLGLNLLSRYCAHDAADHDAVVLGQAFFNDAQLADELPRFDLALLDHVVLVDNQHVASALIAADRDIGHKQG